MHKLRQILIFLERGVSIRIIEKQVKISSKTIWLYQQKLLRTGQSFQELLLVRDQDLERLISFEKVSPPEDADPRKAHFYSQIDYFTNELKHRTGVTRLILWEEYIKEKPDGLQYSRFCKLLQDQPKIAQATMHSEHHPAKMMQVDFAGDVLYYVDPSSSELIACPVFVAVLTFSCYGYVEALPNMKLAQVVRICIVSAVTFGSVLFLVVLMV